MEFKKLKPIEIARQLWISTSALRHYESWGIVPPPERAANGYRIYTEEHAAYFACIRAMLPGFGMDVVKETMKRIRQQETDDALWIVNECQARLHRDKKIAEQTIELLDTEGLGQADSAVGNDWMTIGEIAKMAEVPASAIRHWEKEGLLEPERHEENGYRIYHQGHLRQILLIRTLRSAHYSIEVIREAMKNFDQHDIEKIREIAGQSLAFLNWVNRQQVKGIRYLYELCCLLKLI
mgnify:CR=1 FL=1